jgi:hypothetical protein
VKLTVIDTASVSVFTECGGFSHVHRRLIRGIVTATRQPGCARRPQETAFFDGDTVVTKGKLSSRAFGFTSIKEPTDEHVAQAHHGARHRERGTVGGADRQRQPRRHRGVEA